ncbi:hypothetical protein ABC383_07280 [Noviherbaspirillum sp. 1P10PC]|uniref:hypothetical protein n=1 Tax=Noviherbaspirillum sp. 1P10PC TaxID=3132292 RepID=UPI0039A1DFF3
MKTKFLIADEFRLEASGRHIGIGLWPDDVLVIQNGARSAEAGSDQNYAIERLGFLIVVSGLEEGTHKFRGTIFNPSGIAHSPDIDLGDLEVARGQSASVVLSAKPFVVTEFGLYRFDLQVDSLLISNTFEVRLKGQIQKNEAAAE